MEASWWERLRGKLGIVLMGGAMLSKSLIQLFVDGQGCVPSLLFDLKPDYGGGNEDNVDLLPPTLHQAAAYLCLPCRLLDTQGQVWVSLCGVTGPFSWVLVCTRFCLCPLRVCFASPV